ncbi:hypothetical protein ABZT47_14225 [Sphaerisporangium sp. NPDC005289]|uniref:hypothetical protein n=1 Tax=Sphaerisporangium sp. NPDC005289 TaxID=3155247 RepID=UPI0033B82199
MFPAQPSPDSGMREDRSKTNSDPGAVAPTAFPLLLTRLEDHVKEAGITQNAVCDGAVRSYLAAIQDPGIDTLAMPALGVLSNHIDAAMHACSLMAPGASVSSYASMVTSKATNTYASATNVAADEHLVAQVGLAVRARFDPYVVACERQLYLNHADVPADLKALIQNHAGGSVKDPLVEAAEQILQAAHTPADPTNAEKAALVQALEALPVVQAMYNGKLAVGAGAEGGSLPTIVVTAACKTQKHFGKYADQFFKNAPTGMVIYAALVQPSRRPPARHVSNIEVTEDTVEPGRFWLGTRVTQYRANAARVGNKVRLSVMDDVSTVVHEIGHQVEFYLPAVEWMRLHQIIRMRMVGAQLVNIYPKSEKAEPAFDVSAMPAFEAYYTNPDAQRSGKYYPAKLYVSGDTELLSMTVQFFSRPDTATLMIQRDPVLAATVLRAIRPDDFVNFPANLLALLPA